MPGFLDLTIEDGDLKARLKGLKGIPLRTKARRSVSTSLRRVFVPALRANVPKKYGGHAGKYPTKGLLAKKVSVRGIKARQGEIGAWSIKSRAWIAHMVTQGTKPHLISARVGRFSASNRTIRDSNKGLGTASALFFNGQYAERVEHPGAQPNPWVRMTLTSSLGAQVTTQLGKDLMR